MFSDPGQKNWWISGGRGPRAQTSPLQVPASSTSCDNLVLFSANTFNQREIKANIQPSSIASKHPGHPEFSKFPLGLKKNSLNPSVLAPQCSFYRERGRTSPPAATAPQLAWPSNVCGPSVAHPKPTSFSLGSETGSREGAGKASRAAGQRADPGTAPGCARWGQMLP